MDDDDDFLGINTPAAPPQPPVTTTTRRPTTKTRQRPIIPATTPTATSVAAAAAAAASLPLLASRPPPCFQTKCLSDPLPLSSSERLDHWRHALNLGDGSNTPNSSSPLDKDACPTSLRNLVRQTVTPSPPQHENNSGGDDNNEDKIIQRLYDIWGSFSSLAFEHVDTLTPRTQSLLKCLLAFHDPVLAMLFQSNNVTCWYQLPDLFGMYGDIARLVDLAILSGVCGFDTPQLGSFYFAVGLLVSKRSRFLSLDPVNDDTVRTLIQELANNECRQNSATDDSSVELAIAVASRAAFATPAYFSRLLGEVEMTSLQNFSQRAAEYLDMSLQAKRAHPPPPSVVPPSTPRSTTSSSTAATDTSTTKTWWNSVVNNIVPLTGGGAPDGSTETLTMTQLIKRSVPAAIAMTPKPSVTNAKNMGTGLPPKPRPVPRRLYLCEYKGVRKLGVRLGATPDGLTVKGFDRVDGGMGEAEEEGKVQVGDLMHAVNGVSVVLLSSKLAGRVIQAQDRPLHVVYSTPAGKPGSIKLSEELLKEQRALLHNRLYVFYGRHGGCDKQNRVDDLLRLFAGKEIGFLRALSNKYGDKVPGDPTLSPVVAVADPREIVEAMIRASSDTQQQDVVFVDARTQAERLDTGMFESSFLIGPDEIGDMKHIDVLTTHISKLKSKQTRINIISSGKARLSWMTDPRQARAEQQEEDAFVTRLASLLWARGVFHVGVVQGGFVSVFRELKTRVGDVSMLESGASDVRGRIRRGCDAFAKVDFEDAKSVTGFIMSYFDDFVESVATPPQSSSSNNNHNKEVSGGLVASGVGKEDGKPRVGGATPPPPRTPSPAIPQQPTALPPQPPSSSIKKKDSGNIPSKSGAAPVPAAAGVTRLTARPSSAPAALSKSSLPAPPPPSASSRLSKTHVPPPTPSPPAQETVDEDAFGIE